MIVFILAAFLVLLPELGIGNKNKGRPPYNFSFAPRVNSIFTLCEFRLDLPHFIFFASRPVVNTWVRVAPFSSSRRASFGSGIGMTLKERSLVICLPKRFEKQIYAKFKNNLDRFFLAANTRFSICASTPFKLKTKLFKAKQTFFFLSASQ
jgi:hypothetical protein